ncbi:UDP-2,3-diacylglucosamine diphosphatase [Halopseudomonas pertucinogena]|uniref:UDP-2,3-diacylglucosamine hydrolase n=1 Tax=Halopseudomonas pertucinogena TaxID=86175 RepID=A0ABQ2CUJ1_9GAMM|nr:UDP-2,3-diacylglucosamine diphosphatase [Halopseudomonas pertucinogena]GGJ07502.1 UDP-2,3-diacylglucosamine hydrolase [Halopseudomonas pertucinogena]
MRCLFISDLHLEAQRPDITRAFLRFLQERAKGAGALYILGDFFEVWLGDDNPDPLADEISAALLALSRAGTSIYVMHGNRDFLIGRDFCRRSGCILLRDPTVIRLNGERVLLMHGDSLCIDDTGYMRMRRWLRNPASLFILRHLPLQTRHRIGRKLRNESQQRTRYKALDITDVNQDEVIRVMREHRATTLIHGHTHRPAVHSLEVDGQTAQRIVLGDWDKDGWALEVDGDGDGDGYRLGSFGLG